MMMRALIMVLTCWVVPAILVQLDPADPLEPLDQISELEFEEIFNVAPADTIDEEIRREEALKEDEELVHRVNQEFEEGRATWFDTLDEYSNLPAEEFEAERTGAVSSGGNYSRGLLAPPAEFSQPDEASERYFSRFRVARASPPAAYSSVSLGLVSPVKNQYQCGSCVAFASMAAVETCYRKVTGAAYADLAEQEFVDCGFGYKGANGCNGAPFFSYLDYTSSKKVMPAHESQYPYLFSSPKLSCPADIKTYNQGARVSTSYYTMQGDETLLKQMVAEHGAVVTTVNTDNDFKNYKQGVYAGCTSKSTDHAVTVVGYGSDNGVDYWLVKNSWGPDFGENGFIRIKRGVGMCGIGQDIAVVDCSTVAGATDAPLTTAIPCVDGYSNCPTLAATSCYQPDIKAKCVKSCGLCPGMTPAASVSCFDNYSNCGTMAEKYCYQDSIKKSCKKSCGLCAGMTPAPSNTCYDTYSNCGQLCGSSYASLCKKACNLC